jgi:hypothetical protein
MSNSPMTSWKASLEGFAESFPLHRWPYHWVVFYMAGMLISNRMTDCGTLDHDKSIRQHDVLVNLYRVSTCGPSESLGFHLGDLERKIMFALTVLGVFGFVIPRFVKRDGAARHFASDKVVRVLLVHIISGTSVVLVYPIIGIFFGGLDNKEGGMLLNIIMILDLLHCITSIRLLKNHDGTFALRIGNFLAMIAKFNIWVNLDRHDPYFIDLLFLSSFGFMGTRLAAVAGAFTMIFTKSGDGYYLEHYYSIGLQIAQFHIMLRTPGGVRVWLSYAPLVSYVYYHELWKRKFRWQFFALNVVGSCFALAFLTYWQQVAYITVYYVLCFRLPIFYRIPLLAAAGTVDEDKISQDTHLSAVYRRTELALSDTGTSFRMRRASIEVGNAVRDSNMNFGTGAAWVPTHSMRDLGQKMDRDEGEREEEMKKSR